MENNKYGCCLNCYFKRLIINGDIQYYICNYTGLNVTEYTYYHNMTKCNPLCPLMK